MNWATERIAVGPGRFLSAWRLRRHGITHVINVRERQDPRSVRRHLHYIHVPMQDDGLLKPRHLWEAVIYFAKDALQDPEAKLYIHCNAGMHRGPAAAYAVLRSMGYAPEVAWAKVKKARPKVRPRYVKDVDA